MSSSSEQLKKNIQAYFIQLTQGCGRTGCTNPNCFSNSSAQKLDKNHAVKRAFDLATQNNVSNLCASHPVKTPEPAKPPPTVTPKKPDVLVPFIKDFAELESLVSAAREAQSFTPVVRLLGSVFGSPESLEKSFKSPDPNMELDYDLNQEDLEKTYKLILECPENVQNSFRFALERAAQSLKSTPSTCTPRNFIILLNCPLTTHPDQSKTVLQPLIIALALPQARAGMRTYWESLSTEKFKKTLELFEEFIAHRLTTAKIFNNSDPAVTSAAVVLKPLFEINEEKHHVEFAAFYNDTLSEKADLPDDYRNWKDSARGFSFCNFPFLLTPFYKSQLLAVESKLEQRNRRSQAMGQFLMGVGSEPVLAVRVRREKAVEDTLHQLGLHPAEDLRKEMRVQFVGEEGVDEGGVKKELFQLIVREIFDPQFGMFIHNKETGSYWFNPNSSDFAEFHLIGTILGLAIYNNVILDIRFPKFMYKKLYGKSANIEDIKSYDPSLYSGLKNLLEYKGTDVEDIFGLTFQVTYKNEYGENATFELKENGEKFRSQTRTEKNMSECMWNT